MNKTIDKEAVYKKYIMWFNFYHEMIYQCVKKRIYVNISDIQQLQLMMKSDAFQRIRAYEGKLHSMYGSTWEKMRDYHFATYLFLGHPLNEEELSLLYHKFD